MQERLIHGPHAALAVAPTASAEDARTAFLELTKTYHPARFGRMSVDVQKMSNEVFLALRAAHDTIVKAARGRSSQQLPALPGAAIEAAKQGRAQLPLPPRQPRLSSPPLGHEAKPPTTARTMTPATGVRVTPQPRTTSQPLPAARPTPSPARPGTPPRAATSAPGRQTGSPPVAGTPRDDLATATDLVQRGEWEQAHAMFESLAARDPSPRVRAMAAYARGREAQLAQRVNEARVELDTALQIDPDLQLAKTALAELFTRRK